MVCTYNGMFSPLKRKKILQYATIWMNFEDTMLSEDWYDMIPLYEVLKIVKIIDSCTIAAVRAGEKETTGIYRLMNTEFEFYRKSLKMARGDGSTTLWMYLIIFTKWRLKNRWDITFILYKFI